MIRELGGELPEHTDAYDLCVVGSGPAAMTLVNELRDARLRICVLESGRLEATPHADRLREVESVDFAIREHSRERRLGGSSSTWGGLTSPLEPIDVGPRPELGWEGWPIAWPELEQLYRDASSRYRFPPLELFRRSGFDEVRPSGTLKPQWRDLEEKVFLAQPTPPNFGREWIDVFDVPGIDLWLDATVLRLEATGESEITHAVVRASSGLQFRVQAGSFVVAAGAIENARLLLCSPDGSGTGLGNAHDQVGRYFMNHLKNPSGILLLSRPLRSEPYFFGCTARGYVGYAGIRMSDVTLRSRGLHDCYVKLEPLHPWSEDEGVEALVMLAQRSKRLTRLIRSRGRRRAVEVHDNSEISDYFDLEQEQRRRGAPWRLVWRLVVHFPRVLQYLAYRLTPLVPTVRSVRIRSFMEMGPHPENRVSLSAARDANDEPKASVSYRCTALDRQSLRALHEVLARELEEQGIGRLESFLAGDDDWPIDQDASHHMGTTRMGRDPRTSVVDPNCRIHGVANVYLAGSSVFPTSGCANPTYTIVALSIRLAAHLRCVVTPRE